MVFFGTYHHTLDPRNRIFIPVDFRDALGEKFPLFLHPDGYVTLYTNEEWERVSEKLEKKVETSEDPSEDVKLKDYFYTGTLQCNMDKQGRVTLQADVLKHANIVKDVVIVGARNKISIWDPERLEASKQTVDPNAFRKLNV